MTQPTENNTKQNAAMDSSKAEKKRGKRRDRKERKSNTLLLILVILILSAIVSFGAILLFNFAGLKAETSMWITNIPVVGKLLKPIVENKNPEQIAKEEIELEKVKNAVLLKEIEDKKKELDKREKDIEGKERALAEKEQELNETLQQLSGKLTSVQEQVQYLEKVDNTRAMQIIMSMDSKESAVQLLRNMKKDKASAILALMDPLQAAQLLEDLAEQATEESTSNP